jgi:hypothetical protein
MYDTIVKLWRQFGPWHWLLTPLIVAEAILAVAYEFQSKYSADKAKTQLLWLAMNWGAIIVLAFLALSIAVRFSDNSYEDDSFCRRIYLRINRVGYVAAGMIVCGLLILVATSKFFESRTMLGQAGGFLGFTLCMAGMGIAATVRIVRTELWSRSLGAGFYSDEALERMSSIDRAYKIYAPVAIVLGTIVFVAVEFIG